MPITRPRSASSLALLLAVTVAALTADSGAQHQQSSQSFGVSGGNVNDRSRRFCCSGTLGSLVADGAGNRYILSNNHVLARTNQAQAGEDISQPGLIDNRCGIAELVGDLTAYPLVGSSNVDAAIAELRPGAMSETGEILDIGVPSATTAAPAVGLAVAKSGRTTGLTQAAISAVNASVLVQYQQGCGSGRKLRIAYTNQIVISGSGFSAGGDSGSLIVTNDSQHHPVGLLFAGSSTTTIANPIDEVLSRVGTALGSPVSFDLGGQGGGGGQPRGGGSALSPNEIARATRAKDAHESALLSDPSVLGVGVGEDPNEPGRAALVVFVQRGGRAAVARELNGVRTRVVETDPIVAYGWNEPTGTSCQAR